MEHTDLAASSLVSLSRLGGPTDGPEEILWWAAGRSKKLIQISNFGLEDQVITHVLYDVLGLRIPVFFIDSLHNPPETLDLVVTMRDEHGIDLVHVTPFNASTRQEFERHYGKHLDPKTFHQITRIEPFHRGLDTSGADAWISGRRRDARPGMPVFDMDWAGRLRVNPLAYWSLDRVRSYITENRVPYSVLDERKFAPYD